MVLRLKSQAFLADFSRFDLGVALRLWDGDYRQKGLQEKLEVHYSPELSSALVEAVRKVELDFTLLSPDAHRVPDLADVVARFVAVYPEVTQEALSRLSHSFCMSNR